ncbi:MAG: hypothetical protein B6227_01680 [Fusobacteriia bacterium 4572_74]|nr:MAG: hypothetical protein B6227_01680 [Fusobacteriia bacterium 4572_74]
MYSLINIYCYWLILPTNINFVIELIIQIIYIGKDNHKMFFRDNIIAYTAKLLKKHFRNENTVGRLCTSKFIISAPSEKIPLETIKFKFKNIVRELKIKYPFICSEDILWKNMYINSGEDIFKKFKELESIEYNNITPLHKNIIP